MFGRKTRWAILPLSLALGACATTAPAPQASSGEITSSELYVHQVNNAADRQGVQVIWVNPPKGGEAVRLSYSLQATVGDEDGED